VKLLADENFPLSLISALQKKRHDVKRIQRTSGGVSDLSVRDIAKRENRMIITFDRDILDVKPEKQVSAMLFHFPQMTPEEILPYLDGAIEAIIKLKKKKKPFSAIYSINELQNVTAEKKINKNTRN